jgi:hypothetical protein
MKSLTTESDFELKSANLLNTAKDLIIKAVFSVKNNEVSLLKGQRFSRTAVRGAVTTISASDYLIGVTALAVATSIGLPRPSKAGPGKTYIIKDEAGGANTTNITIRSDGEKTIDGATSTTLNTAYQSKQFYSDGSNWFTC